MRDRAIARALEFIGAELAAFIGRSDPLRALRDVRVEISHEYRRLDCRLLMHDGESLGLVLPSALPRRIARDLPREIRSLYSRLYEDELVRRQVAPALQQLEEAQRNGADHFEIQRRADVLQALERHVRRFHDTAFRYGIDTAARLDRTVVAGINAATGETLSSSNAPSNNALTAEDVLRAMRELDRDMGRAVAPPQPRTYRGIPIEELARAGFDPGIFSVDPYSLFAEVGDRKAQAKGETLLKEWLSPAQLTQYERDKSFEVTGSAGTRFRIRHGRQMNIDQLDAKGQKVCGWCFLPEGQLVAGDCMLAQKIALETDEAAALKVANRFGAPADMRPGMVTWIDEAAEIPRRIWLDGDWQMAVRRDSVVVAEPTS